MPSKYSTLLFDMDGTIADTDEMIAQTFFRLYDRYGLKRKSREEMVYFSGPPIRDTLKKEFPSQNQETLFKEFHDISWSLYPQYVKGYQNDRETLLSLKKEGYHLGVVTNKMHKTSLYCLQLIHLDDIFDIVVGFDDVKLHKPDKEGIMKAMKFFLEEDERKVLYVGDNESDLLTARHAGVDCALMTWGPRHLNPSLTPEYTFSSFAKLQEALINE